MSVPNGTAAASADFSSASVSESRPVPRIRRTFKATLFILFIRLTFKANFKLYF